MAGALQDTTQVEQLPLPCSTRHPHRTDFDHLRRSLENHVAEGIKLELKVVVQGVIGDHALEKDQDVQSPL